MRRTGVRVAVPRRIVSDCMPLSDRPTSIWQVPEVARWIHLHPDARKLAPHIEAAINQVERYSKADSFQLKIRDLPAWRYELAKMEEELEAESATWSVRRRAELALADYIADIPDPYNVHGLDEVVEKLRTCRQRGALGLKPEGGHVIAWDRKCNLVRLCPDESREETQRLGERYVPAIREWVSAKPGRRLFYAVLTQHNYRPGQLAAGKRHQFEAFKDFLDLKYQACPVEFRRLSGSRWKSVRPNKKRTIAAWPQIQGALVVQEDPLSARDDWNVHLNVLLLVEGEFSYERFRQDWGANVEIRQVDPAGLARTILELVKYSAQTVASKSAEKAAQGASEAPPMVQWTHERWVEWWQAQQGFRRTRSYGALFGVKAPDETVFDMSLVEWVGAVSFDRVKGYSVDLIPEDNSRGSEGGYPRHARGSDYYDTGPPAWPH